MARHARPRPRPSLLRRVNRPTRRKLLAVAAVAVGLAAVSGVAGVAAGVAPTVAADSVSFPLPDRAEEPVARGGPMDYAPAQPPVIVAAAEPVWHPGKGPVIVDGQPLATRPALPRPAAAAAPTPEPTPVAAGTPSPAAGEQQPALAPLEEPVIGLPPVGPVTEPDTEPVIDGPPPDQQPPPAVVDPLEEETTP